VLAARAGRLGRPGRGHARTGRENDLLGQLAADAAVTHAEPVDAAYWQPAVAPKAGQIVTVTLWGRSQFSAKTHAGLELLQRMSERVAG
jgi:hypothetical protein